MLEPRYETEVSRKVFDNKNGGSITIGPDSDGLGLLAVEGGDEFGRLTMPAEIATLVAQAILAAASEMTKGKA